MKVSVGDAKNRLSELLKAVEKGETITVCRHGKPIADIVRTKMSSGMKRKLGTGRGEVTFADPDWWKPMSDEEADAFISGQY